MIKSPSSSKIYKRLIGQIVSVTSGTAVVAVPSVKLSPRYHKRFTRHRHYHTHNPANKFSPGQWVVIEECRPLSRLKRWRITGLKSEA